MQQYQQTMQVVQKQAVQFGLATGDLESLDLDSQEILQQANPALALRFDMPTSPILPDLIIELDARLPKTTNNFIALCKGGRKCKTASKPFCYRGVPVHRIVAGLIAQSGDVTRSDGTGGESLYGKTFNDEKEGLKVKHRRGAVGMANSGRNSNSSQFYIVLADDKARLSKLDGAHVIFGQIVPSADSDLVLQRLNEAGTAEGQPQMPVWIDDCGVIDEC